MGALAFFPATDKAIPPSIMNASSHVYKLTSQGGHLNRVISVTDVDQVRLAQEQFAGDNMWWQKTQLEFCINNKLDICSIFDQLGDGSAFTINTSNSLYTNLHNFYETISANISLDKTKTTDNILKRNLHVPLLFALSDQNGKSVVNTSKTIIGTLEFFNPSPLLLGTNISIMNSALGRISDVVRIHLIDTSASPLRISKVPPKFGDKVYLVGYPSETTDRSKIGAIDSDGNSMRISTGNIISFADWKQRTGNNFGVEAESLLQKNLIFFDADCEHGNSGGPLLNTDGEVIGIMMALYRDAQKGSPYRICGALNTLNETKLMELWNASSQ